MTVGELPVDMNGSTGLGLGPSDAELLAPSAPEPADPDLAARQSLCRLLVDLGALAMAASPSHEMSCRPETGPAAWALGAANAEAWLGELPHPCWGREPQRTRPAMPSPWRATEEALRRPGRVVGGRADGTVVTRDVSSWAATR